VAARVDQGPLRWSDLPPPWLLTLIVLAGFVWVRTLYRRERGGAGRWQRLGLAALRTVILLLVLLVLGGPYRQEERKAIERSHLVVLVDSSASMNVKDSYEPSEERRLLDFAFSPGTRPADLEEVSRGDLVRRALSDDGAALLRKWGERFVLHVFAFDADWRSLGSTEPRRGTDDEDAETDRLGPVLEQLETLQLDGGRTRLGAVLRNVANEFARRQDQHLAGVVLLSDGRDTSDGEPPQQVLATMGAVKEEMHVAAVGMGNPASGKNLWVERIRAKEWVLVQDEVLFETALRHTDFDDHRGPVAVEMTIAKVAEENGEPIVPPRPYEVPVEARDELRQRVERLGHKPRGALRLDRSLPTPIRMQAPFDETGTFRVSIKARFVDEEDRRLDSIPSDDLRHHEIRVVDQRIRVLYVDNQPRHDWRFLSNYLTREPGKKHESQIADARSRFQVHVLLQSADPAYLQPASVGETPIKEFPRTRRELFAYDVIILGDVDWRKFDRTSVAGSRRILELISDFVEEGGGLALQAGVDYLNPIDFLNTPLAALLPLNVRTQDKAASERYDRPFFLRLTAAGRNHPIFAVVPGTDGRAPTPVEIDSTWSGEQPGLSDEWYWWWLYRAAGGLRPGAVDLARVRVKTGDMSGFTDLRREPLVVFATMGFGKGQVFWSSLDSISRIRRAQRDRIYGAFWEQIIRYLATYRLLGGNKRFKIFTDEDSYFVGQTATVTITALDEYFEPLRDEYLAGVFVEMPDDSAAGSATELTGDKRPRLMSDEGAMGTYRLVLPLKKQGLVRIWIDRSDTTGAHGTKERAEKRFEVNFRAKEDILKVPDHDTLTDIVRATNPRTADAKAVKLYEVADVVERMQAQPRERVLDRRERTQWDKLWVLLLITGLLAVEWILRKRYQMI
jgi:uncharacterized membrane protein